MSDHVHGAIPEEIGCLESIEALYAYLDGEIRDPAELARIEHHLSHCQSCYSRAELERRLSQRLGAGGRQRAPEDLQRRLRALLDKL